MLEVTFPDLELWDELNQRFVIQKNGTFRFEHSLLSISKWEMKYKKPFLVDDNKTPTELLDYFECMCLDKSFNKGMVDSASADILARYINEPQTATTIKVHKKPGQRQSIMTSEVLYASMAMNGVPFLADKWPLSRLMSVLGVIGDANTDPKDKKMSRAEMHEENQRINAIRRAELKSKG